MKRNKNSKYLITRLYSIDYFYYYSTPAFFSAYFFPFVAKGESRAYLDAELDKKISNVKSYFHGNFYNYATQGFGNVAFDKKQISFGYFYDRLVSYEIEKNKYFNIVDGVAELETEQTKKDIFDVLNESGLMLRRDIEVPVGIRKELIDDLRVHEVKYVLAKILYYIIDETHTLPNVGEDYYEIITQSLNLKMGKPNIYFTFRENTDLDKKSFCELLLMTKEVQILCYDGISIFGNEKIYRNCMGIQKEIVEIMDKNEKLEIEIILRMMPNKDFDDFCIEHKHIRVPKESFSKYSIDSIKDIAEYLNSKRLYVKTTSQHLPYSLMICKFEDESLDFIKLDMYSPFINDNMGRPSMYILKKVNGKMYEHFLRVFDCMWSDDRYSQFVGGK